MDYRQLELFPIERVYIDAGQSDTITFANFMDAVDQGHEAWKQKPAPRDEAPAIMPSARERAIFLQIILRVYIIGVLVIYLETCPLGVADD